MDAFEGLEPLPFKGKPALDECFVDIPDCLETTSERLDSSSREDQGNMVLESLLQPDYSSFFLWSSEFAQSETKGTAEIWRTGAGIMLPAESTDRTFLSSLSRRLSEETLQSSQTPFKSGYCAKSESELLRAQEGEPMVFVPSTVSTSYGEGSQKLEEEVEMRVKKCSRRKGKPAFKRQTSRNLMKLKVKRSSETGVSKGAPVGRGSRKKAAVEMPQATDASEGSSKQENANPETPTSTVSTLPIASRKGAKPKGAVSLERKQLSSKRTALQQSSPNVPSRRASKQLVSSSAVVCGTSTGADESQKPSRKRTKINFADEAESAPSQKQGLEVVEHASEETGPRTKKARRPKKNQKKTLPKESLQILIEWARSSKMIPYPDKETKQELADAAGLSVYQVDNWLAGARNRTHIIEVPQELKLLSKNLRGKACEQGAG